MVERATSDEAAEAARERFLSDWMPGPDRLQWSDGDSFRLQVVSEEGDRICSGRLNFEALKMEGEIINVDVKSFLRFDGPVLSRWGLKRCSIDLDMGYPEGTGLGRFFKSVLDGSYFEEVKRISDAFKSRMKAVEDGLPLPEEGIEAAETELTVSMSQNAFISGCRTVPVVFPVGLYLREWGKTVRAAAVPLRWPALPADPGDGYDDRSSFVQAKAALEDDYGRELSEKLNRLFFDRLKQETGYFEGN